MTNAAVMLIVQAIWGAVPANPPLVTFCRSGPEVIVNVADQQTIAVRLTAFGRTWAQADRRNDGTFHLAIPAVRVPTLFQLVSTRKQQSIVGEVVAYPDRDSFEWQKEAAIIIIIDRSAPRWLPAWMTAVGLPFRSSNVENKSLAARPPDAKNCLLILHQKFAMRKRPPERQSQVFNQLVFGFSTPSLRTDKDKYLEINPAAMQGALESLHGQTWSQPLRFHRYSSMWNGIANRRSWIRSASTGAVSTVGVEEILNTQHSGRIILNYLPWERQLGRNEMADVLFLQLLKSVAQPGEAVSFNANARWVRPQTSEIDANNRPVIAAVVAAAKDEPHFSETVHSDDILWILDLRGGNIEPSEIAAVERILRGRKKKTERLLVLGTDPQVAKGRWSRDRIGQKRTKDGRVVWLTDDVLPSSTNGKGLLMQTLTEFGVRLPVFQSQ